MYLGEDDLNAYRIHANMLNTQMQTGDMGWSTAVKDDDRT
jgi:hypothetical protein